jgi:hypothetical protein
MTKEAIIEKHKSVESRRSDFGGYNFEYLNKTSAGQAMDEYAKQQAIAFARFINNRFNPHGDNYLSKNTTDDVVYFTDELYSQFIDNQIQTKDK